MKFTDVCIFTEDVISLVEFYEKVFHIDADKDATYSVLTCADLTITFYDKKQAESLMGFDFSKSGHGMTYVGFNVEDIDEEYQRLSQLGIEGISEPTLWP